MSDEAETTNSRTERHLTWLQSALPLHGRLTEAAVTIIKGLLAQSAIDTLSVSGRTKDQPSIIEKIKRKSYSNPPSQMTDISGIRIIVFVESDVQRVCDLIENAFTIDPTNSSNKDFSLLANQVGYRSVHYVCDIGRTRRELKEYEGIGRLKFEVQIRTVLQHAWAELAHDRSYKFQPNLPSEIQRKLYLHAGLLELADKGFAEIAADIDAYNSQLRDDISTGDLTAALNSLSLQEFFSTWVRDNGLSVPLNPSKANINELVEELKEFGVADLKDLQEIIPPDYVPHFRSTAIESSIFGIVRDWMTMTDAEKLYNHVRPEWLFEWQFDTPEERDLFEKVLSPRKFQDLQKLMEDHFSGRPSE